MRDVIIVGAGIIGATAAKVLSDGKADVLLLDDGRPMSGTAPSGGHLRPSWFGDMKKDQYEPAMRLLDETWGLAAEEFAYVVDGKTQELQTVYRVDTDVVTQYPRKTATVTSIDNVGSFPAVTYTLPNGTPVRENTKLLLVAAGVWCRDLLGRYGAGDVTGKQGVSFRLKTTIPQPFIAPWAPYKQVVAHQQGPDEVWIGEGSAILPKNWGDRTRTCLERCLAALPEESNKSLTRVRTIEGVRPYAPPGSTGTDPCLLKQLGPRAWVATGSGKSGTISAGWVSRRLLDAHA